MLFNAPRAIAYMRQAGLDALIATSPVNVTYFTDYELWTDGLFKEYMMSPGAPSSLLAQGYAVFPLEGEPALVTSPLAAVNAVDSWVKDVVIAGDPGLETSIPPGPMPDRIRRFYDLVTAPNIAATPTDALMRILKARGLTEARIGLDMDGLTPGPKAALPGLLPRAQLKDCSNLIRLLRAVKTEDELERLTRGAEISEKAGMESLAMARPGVPASHLVENYRKRIGEMGANLDHFSFGIRGLGFGTWAQYDFSDDDLLEVDWGCIYRLVFTDTGTTLSIRQPSAQTLETHASLRACLIAASKIMAPGVKASAVRNAMWDTLTSRGITISFPHGHGLGLEVRDYPIVVANNGLRLRDDCIDVPSDLPLEPNMVINLEAAVRRPGVGSIHIEQSFVVTADGQRPLVPQDRTKPFVPAGAA